MFVYLLFFSGMLLKSNGLITRNGGREVLSPPELRNDVWWGAGNATCSNSSEKITKFAINVSTQVLYDLENQLGRFLSRPLIPTLEGEQFQYGFNTNYLRQVVQYWKNGYLRKWREREDFLNTYPQYTTVVNGLRLHFVRVTPTSHAKKIVPLLLLHGWPGSVREFYEIIPMLTRPELNQQDFVFEIILPSLPGYGWSEGPSKPGMGPIEMAVVLSNLMAKLGIKKYYVQGGDWGSVLVRVLAILFPKRILGLHSNLCLADSSKALMAIFLGSLHPSLVVTRQHQHLLYPLGRQIKLILDGAGYFHEQATRPDTLGIALSDTPTGLAAYILEKFSFGTNSDYSALQDGGIPSTFSLDALMDNVMIYWITNSITTSMRLYSEFLTSKEIRLNLHERPITVPSACIRFRHDIAWHSERLLRLKYHNLVQITDEKSGGHFAALEKPEVLSKDIFKAIAKMENIHKRD